MKVSNDNLKKWKKSFAEMASGFASKQIAGYFNILNRNEHTLLQISTC